MHVDEWSGVQKHSVTECEIQMSSMHEECMCNHECYRHDICEMFCNECNQVHQDYLMQNKVWKHKWNVWVKQLVNVHGNVNVKLKEPKILTYIYVRVWMSKKQSMNMYIYT